MDFCVRNVIFSLLLIFGIFHFRKGNEIRMDCSGLLSGFFMSRGASIIGTVSIMLEDEKICLAVLVLFMAYRLWVETWNVNKLFMIAPLLAFLSIALFRILKSRKYKVLS